MKICPGCSGQIQDDATTCLSCGYAASDTPATDRTRLYADSSDEVAIDAPIADRYQVVRELGRGGMGMVYLVEDLRLGRQSALKIIQPTLVANPEARERFTQEVNLCLDLIHKSIVRVYDLREWQGRQFFTMEYINGRNLRDELDARNGQIPPFSLEEAFRVKGTNRGMS